jgi:outer membrane protein TolC
MRFNEYRSAQINGAAAPGYSAGQAMAAIEDVFKQTMPRDDVSDALIAYRKNTEFREQQELLTASAKDAARLSNIRYKGGVTSYLEVLTNETNFFTAELNLAQAQANELLALVQIYQALGGGWQL